MIGVKGGENLKTPLTKMGSLRGDVRIQKNDSSFWDMLDGLCNQLVETLRGG